VRGDNLNSHVVGVLAGEAFAGVDSTLEVTGVAIGSKDRVAFCKYPHRDELFLPRCVENQYALYAIISPDIEERL